MSDLRHTCHECGQPMSYPPHARGMEVSCPHCAKNTSLVEAYPSNPQPLPAQPAGAAPTPPAGSPPNMKFYGLCFWLVVLVTCSLHLKKQFGSKQNKSEEAQTSNSQPAPRPVPNLPSFDPEAQVIKPWPYSEGPFLRSYAIERAAEAATKMNSQQRQGTQPLEENIYLQSTLMLEWHACEYSLQGSPDRRKLFIILPEIRYEVELITSSKFESSDIRNNAFGARVEVVTKRRTTDNFRIENLETFQCNRTAYLPKYSTIVRYVIKETIDLTENVEWAANRYVKNAIASSEPISATDSWDRPFRVYFIFTLADPYLKAYRSDVASDRATFNSPVEHKDSSNDIFGNVKAIWICDKTSGKVLRKIDVSQPNSVMLAEMEAEKSKREAEKSKREAAEVRVVEFQKKRAADGSDVAQYDLALRYLDGKGVEPNRDEAIKLLRQSAAQNNTKAKKKLAELGVPLP